MTESYDNVPSGRPGRHAFFPDALVRGAAAHPDKEYLCEVSGPNYTYGQSLDRALRLAAALQDKGIGRGDRVMSMIPTSADSVIIMAATAFVGAIHVPVNTAYVGYMLEHALNVTTPAFFIVDARFAARLQDITMPEDIQLGIRGEFPSTTCKDKAASVTVFASMLRAEPMDAAAITPVEWDETGMLLFTSGTTGVSKAVIIPWYHLYLSSIRMWQSQALDENVRFYCPWPINHVTGAGAAYMVALLGGTLVVREKWSTSNFVADVTNYRCNTTDLMAEMVRYFEHMEGLEQTTLSHIFVAPVTESIGPLLTKLGIRYCTTYNSTETNSPIGSIGYEPVPAGSCGVLRPGLEARLVDGNGDNVSQDTPGELLLKSEDPTAMNGGYWGMPDKSNESWRNGWFHTGDVLRVDENGYFYFVARLKDRIKVRGENVNPDEVELVVRRHDNVEQCSAVGVPLPEGGDEIYLFVVPSTKMLDADDLTEFCRRELPKFMRPARIIVEDKLPMTPTGKVQRSILRDRFMNG